MWSGLPGSPATVITKTSAFETGVVIVRVLGSKITAFPAGTVTVATVPSTPTSIASTGPTITSISALLVVRTTESPASRSTDPAPPETLTSAGANPPPTNAVISTPAAGSIASVITNV